MSLSIDRSTSLNLELMLKYINIVTEELMEPRIKKTENAATKRNFSLPLTLNSFTKNMTIVPMTPGREQAMKTTEMRMTVLTSILSRVDKL